MITLTQLSSMVQPIDYHEYKSRPFSVYVSIAPVFYLAARNGGIELLDVIYALRRCTLMTYMLTAQVLQAEDIAVVELGIKCLQAQDNLSSEMQRCIVLLEAWLEDIKA